MKPSLDGKKVDVVEVLRGATAIKELVDQQVKAAVFLLRSHAGLTWADIGGPPRHQPTGRLGALRR